MKNSGGSWAGLLGVSGWTDDGTVVRLTTITDTVGVGTVAPVSQVDVTKTAIGATPVDTNGIRISNTTAAAAGAQQYSPPVVWQGQGWKTDATAASQKVEFMADVRPVQGAAAPTGYWGIYPSIADGAYSATPAIAVTNAGFLAIGTASPDVRFHAELDSATTNAAVAVGRLSVTSTGTPAAGLGAQWQFEVETAANNNEVVAAIDGTVTDVTPTAEVGAVVIKTMTAGAAPTEKMRIDSNGITLVRVTTPGMVLKDSDGAVADDNGHFYGNLTDVGDGTEDFDIYIRQQVAGTMTTFLFADADGNLELGTAAQDTKIIGNLVPGTTKFFSTTTTLTTAQVNALRATPITVVAAQGANTWIELVTAVITYDYATAAFTVAADEDLVIEYADGTDATASIETAGFLDQVDDEIRYYPFALTAGADPEATIGQALRIFNTGAGEIADGGGEVDIRITYRVYSTGF